MQLAEERKDQIPWMWRRRICGGLRAREDDLFDGRVWRQSTVATRPNVMTESKTPNIGVGGRNVMCRLIPARILRVGAR